MVNVNIEESWAKQLADEFDQPYFQSIVQFLKTEKALGKVIFPEGKAIFKAFELTPFDDVKVLILGQDPYHGEGQAHGLCFSVQHGIKPPPSLVNVFKELQQDLGIPIPKHGNLSAWAKQGVLLLNASLTVEAHKPMSHAQIGWSEFTDAVIQRLSSQKTGIVFLLWGRFAQQKEVLIDTSKHFVLKAAHPSPFSAHNGFLGCKHFSQTNTILSQQQKIPIDWRIDE